MVLIKALCVVCKYHKEVFSLLQLTVVQGDLVKVTADAIVHPTNDTYYMGGEVGMLT